MPTWLLGFLTFAIIFVTLWGALNFPYVPMFFGVYDGERYSFRGKLILKLLWLFPLNAFISLYFAWTSNRLLSLLPLVHVLILWSMRANKPSKMGPLKQHASKQENLADSMSSLDKKWGSWGPVDPARNYLAYTFYAPNQDDAQRLKDALAKAEKIQREFEISSQPNGAVLVRASIKADTLDKDSVAARTSRMVDKAWENGCELWFIDIDVDLELNAPS